MGKLAERGQSLVINDDHPAGRWTSNAALHRRHHSLNTRQRRLELSQAPGAFFVFIRAKL
jgi:hypothetical protein